MKQMPPEYYQLLEELQTVDFVILELTLYLDTHPGDSNAIQQYNQFVKQRKQIKKAFEERYGMLTNFSYSYSHYPYEWPEAPWPWQV